MEAETQRDEVAMGRVWSWLRSFAIRHKVITALAALYVIFKLVMTPIVNPFASDIYTIRGRFANVNDAQVTQGETAQTQEDTSSSNTN